MYVDVLVGFVWNPRVLREAPLARVKVKSTIINTVLTVNLTWALQSGFALTPAGVQVRVFALVDHSWADITRRCQDTHRVFDLLTSAGLLESLQVLAPLHPCTRRPA